MNVASIGFDLSLDTVERLVLAQEELDGPLRDLGAKVRWFEAPELRVSLVVLGQVKEEFHFDLADSIRAVAEALVPFKVSLSGICAYPSPTIPRLLHSEVTLGSDLVTGLQKVLTVRLDRLGIAVDGSEFKPWVVLGRCRSEEGGIDVAEALERSADMDFGSSLVTGVLLLERPLGPRGPRPSSVIRRFPLGKT
jgi:2'-5' RNA ligase